MATQEERIQRLIQRLQGPYRGASQFDAPLFRQQRSQLSPEFEQLAPIQPGSFAAGAASQAPISQSQAAVPPQPASPPEQAVDLFAGFGTGFLPEPITPPEEESQNPLLAVPRGIARGVGQTALTIGEGLFSIADTVTNVAGFEDALDPESSEAFKALQEAKAFVGNEETVVGKLAEALGSILLFAVPGLGAAGAASRGAALAAKGSEYAAAATRVNKLAKGLKGIQYGAFAPGVGAGEASSLIEAYKAAGNDYTVGQRNLAIALGVPIGFLELLPVEMVLRGIPKTIGQNVKSQVVRRLSEASTTGIAEGGQELVAGFLQKFAAQNNYDPDMPLTDSMLSDFGYGAGAGAIFDLLVRGKVKYPKSEKQLRQELESAPDLPALSDEQLAQMQQSEQPISVYDADGNMQSAQVLGVEGDKVKVLINDEDIAYLPKNQTVDPDTGLSFASDADLLSPKYRINDKAVGEMTTQELYEEGLKPFVSPELLPQVEAGNITLKDAIKATQQGDKAQAQAKPDSVYNLKAVEKEKERRNPDYKSNVEVGVASILQDAETTEAVDSGDLSDNIEQTLSGLINEPNPTTVLGRAALTGEESETLQTQIETSSIEREIKKQKVSKKDRNNYIQQVTGSPDTDLAQLTNQQKIDLLDVVQQHQQTKKRLNEQRKQEEAENKLREEGRKQAIEEAAAAASAQQEAKDAQPPETEATEEVVEEEVIEEEAQAEPTTEGFISDRVEKSKPKYRDETPVFDSLLDKALYIVGNPRSRSKADQEIMGDLIDYYERTGLNLSENTIRELGQDVRSKVKEQGEAARAADQAVFSVPQINPRTEQQTTQEESAKEEKKTKRKLKKEPKTVLSEREKQDIGEDVLIDLEGKQDAAVLGLALKLYNEYRQGGMNHDSARNAFSSANEYLDALDQAKDLDFALKTGQPVAGEMVAGTMTELGPGVVKSKAPLDINEFNRVVQVIKSIAPTARIEVASQLFGPARSMDDPNLQTIEINGKEVSMQEALGLQAGNLVAVSLTTDGFLDTNNRAYHEATHFLFNNGFFNAQELKDLQANVGRMQDIVRRQLGDKEFNRAMDGLNPFQQLNELVAYSSALYNRGLDIDGKVPAEFNPPLRRIFSKILKLFKQLRAAFTGERLPAEIEDIFNQVRQGRVGARTPDVGPVKDLRKQIGPILDTSGLSSSTPLYMIKQGPVAASTGMRPAFHSKLKRTLGSLGNDKALPEAWARIDTDAKGKSFVAGKLKGVKLEEFNDSALGTYLATLPENKAVSGKELEEFVEATEKVLEIQIYGTPISRSGDKDAKSEQTYRDALQEERNDLAYESVANNALTSLRIKADRYEGKEAAGSLKKIVNILVNGSPNPDVNNNVFSPDIVDLINKLPLPESIDDIATYEAEISPQQKKDGRELAGKLKKDIDDPNNALSLVSLGQMLVNLETARLYPTQENVDMRMDSPLGSPQPFDVDFGVGLEQGVGYYKQYTQMGGRTFLDRVPESQYPAGTIDQYNYREIVFAITLDNPKGSTFTHAHFKGVRNPILHARLSDYVLDNGEVVLVIEEIQSDMHQRAQSSMRDMATKELFEMGSIRYPDFFRLNREEKNTVREMQDSFRDEVYGQEIPDLPLKNENQRLAFALDQITRMAVQNGYDRIAVVGSEGHKERYRDQLKEHIDGINIQRTFSISDFTDRYSHRVDSTVVDGVNAIQMEITSIDDQDVMDPFAEEVAEPIRLVITQQEILDQADRLSYLAEGPEVDIEGLTERSRELGGIPLSEATTDVISDVSADMSEEVMSGVTQRIDSIFNVPSQGTLLYRLNRDDPRSYLENLNYSFEKEFSEEIDVSAANAQRLVSAIATRAFSDVMSRKYPNVATQFTVAYTVPVARFENGQMIKSSVLSNVIELGDQQPVSAREGFFMQPVLDDWIGDNTAKIIRDQMGDTGSYFAPDLLQSLQTRYAELENLRLQKENGQSLTPEQLASESLLDIPAIKDMKSRITGAIDYPAGSGFENLYDRKVPQILEASLANLSGNTPKQIKKAKKDIRDNNSSKRLYLGSLDPRRVEAAKIIELSEIEDQPTRVLPFADRGQDAEVIRRIQRETADIDAENLAREEEGFAEELPVTSESFFLATSNQRNALKVYEITDDMRVSDKLIESTEIYYAQKQNEAAAVTNHGTENLRGVMKNGRQKAINYVNNIPFFNTLGGLPQKREFYLSRAEYLGTVGRSTKVAEFLRDEIGNKFLFKKGPKDRADTEQLRTTIFNYLTTGEPEAEANVLSQLKALDPRAAAASEKAKDLIENLGLDLVNKGLLNPRTFFANKRSYLPRIYIKHVLEDKRDAAFSYLKPRKDMTKESQESLGVINELDPAFLVSRAIQRPIRDLQFIEFMNSIAGNDAWTTADDQFVVDYIGKNGEPIKVSGFYLTNEARTLREIADALSAADPDKAAKLTQDAVEMENAVRDAFIAKGLQPLEYYEQLDDAGFAAEIQGYGDQFKRVPKNKKYGLLSGRLVRTEIFDDVIASGAMLQLGDAAVQGIASKGRELTAVWKTIKVPLNPPTIARNLFSNAILMHLSGVPFYRVIPRFVEAINEVRAYNRGDFENSKHYAEMLKRGVQQTSFTDQELMQMADDMMDFLSSVDAKDIGMYGWLKLNTWQKLAQKASKVYQGIEVIGKTAINIDVMEREGLSADDGFLRAQEYLFDYSDVPQIVRKIRQSPLGIPFITFQYKVLPALIKTALRNPMRFAPYVALSYALPSLFMSAFDIDDEEYEDVKGSLPDYLRGNPGMIPIPVRDSEGRLQFLDTAYLYPWGSFSQLISDAAIAGKSLVGNKGPADKGFDIKDVTSTLGMFGGPAWSLFGLSQNLDPFTQRPIVNPSDPFFISDAIERPFYRRGQLTDALFWAANQYILPGFLNTEYGAVSKLYTALGGNTKPNGLETDTINQSLLRFIGLNLSNIDPLQIQISLSYIEREKSNIMAAMNSVARDQSLSREERMRRLNNYKRVLDSYGAKIRELTRSGQTTTRIMRNLRRQDQEAERAAKFGTNE